VLADEGQAGDAGAGLVRDNARAQGGANTRRGASGKAGASLDPGTTHSQEVLELTRGKWEGGAASIPGQLEAEGRGSKSFQEVARRLE